SLPTGAECAPAHPCEEDRNDLSDHRRPRGAARRRGPAPQRAADRRVEHPAVRHRPAGHRPLAVRPARHSRLLAGAVRRRDARRLGRASPDRRLPAGPAPAVRGGRGGQRAVRRRAAGPRVLRAPPADRSGPRVPALRGGGGRGLRRAGVRRPPPLPGGRLSPVAGRRTAGRKGRRPHVRRATMGDYGHEPRFGVFPTPSADAFGHVMKVVEAADRGGLDLVGVQDHPYQRRFLDAWALMATVLARTERVRVFPDVAGLPLRPPAVLAKTAASLDVMSGGRFELGLGAGAFWEPIGAMGGPRRSRREAASALIEAVRVVRLMWSGERSVRFEGEYYRLAGVHPGPAPAHPIGVWLGVLGPRLLRETGRSADGWVPSSSYLPPEKLAGAHARIDDAAADADRAPAEIRR